MQVVFQDPYSSLSPRMRVGEIIAEPLEIHTDLSRPAMRERVAEVLELVGLRPDVANLFPHEFSGGQRQRVAIARALATNTRLIVLDEPVSALDVSIRAQIINQLEHLQQTLGVSYLFIGHDLATVAHISHRIAVMYLGQIVETAESSNCAPIPCIPIPRRCSPPPCRRTRKTSARGWPSGEVPSALAPPSGAASTRAVPRHAALRAGGAAEQRSCRRSRCGLPLVLIATFATVHPPSRGVVTTIMPVHMLHQLWIGLPSLRASARRTRIANSDRAALQPAPQPSANVECPDTHYGRVI